MQTDLKSWLEGKEERKKKMEDREKWRREGMKQNRKEERKV
jgi:hypothetical protein